jgi:O-acetyl-ADP-ribose deacetylase (regulator of RNase III)
MSHHRGSRLTGEHSLARPTECTSEVLGSSLPNDPRTVTAHGHHAGTCSAISPLKSQPTLFSACTVNNVVRLGVVRGDITKVAVDAIVNAANSSLLGGGGVDGAIHRAAGPSLVDECRQIVARQGGCNPGEAVITGAGELRARAVIHTVGPVWQEGRSEELDQVLASCYRSSLVLAAANGLVSIAFPSISTGAYGYPKDRAARVATTAVRVSTTEPTSIQQVSFVCFDDEDAELYERLLQPS